jgi:hypothetical protein
MNMNSSNTCHFSIPLPFIYILYNAYSYKAYSLKDKLNRKRLIRYTLCYLLRGNSNIALTVLSIVLLEIQKRSSLIVIKRRILR